VAGRIDASYDLESLPPLPGGSADFARRSEAARRERLLSGAWRQDLIERIAERFGSDSQRKRVMGTPALTSNLAASVARQLSRLYDREGGTSVDGEAIREGDATAMFVKAMSQAGLWTMGRRLQRAVNVVRDGVRRVDVVGPEGNRKLRLMNVPLSHCYMEGAAECPEDVAAFIHARPRQIAGHRSPPWTWDVFDISDPANPQRRVLLARELKADESWRSMIGDPDFDVTAEALGLPEGSSNDARSGDAYEARYADSGRPFVPISMYRLERSGRMTTPFEGAEIVEATYEFGELWHFWDHTVFTASWPQRYTVNVDLIGASGSPSGDLAAGSFNEIESDPSNLLQFKSRGNLPAQLGQWMSGADPSALQMAIQERQDAVLSEMGVAGGAEARSTGSARSGFAIELDRATIREAQTRQEPSFSMADAEILGKAAALSNREALFGSVPEEGWQVAYAGLPPSREERESVRQQVETMGDMGVKPSRPWIVANVLGVAPDTAKSLLAQWTQDEIEERRAAAMAGLPPVPQPPTAPRDDTA